MIDERTERLITRRLDGQLADGESLELDKELIRDPDARRAFEDSQRIDTLAVQTLHALLDASAAQRESELIVSTVRRSSRRLTRWCLDGAIGVAASVLILLVATAQWSDDSRQIDRSGANSSGLQIAGNNAISELPGPRALVAADPQSPALTQVIAGPRRERERIDQDVIGLVDPQTQSIYVLELNGARNTISPVRANY
jgi:anti-sigma factor RsiW